MTFTVTTPQFSGPLDLLLQLIERQEMDISNIALANVTDEYVRYVETLDQNATAQIADFLLVAARLLYIKSKALLPAQEEEEDGLPSLEEQLRAYARFVAVSREVENRFKSEQHAFYREAPLLTGEFIAPKGVRGDVLEQVMRQVADVLGRTRVVRERLAVAPAISIHESLARIKCAVAEGRKFLLHELFEETSTIAERIVHFLAALELVKQRQVYVAQREPFGDIVLTSAV